MGRKAIYTKKEFVTAYKKVKSVKELASVLNISIPTVFSYITRYNLLHIISEASLESNSFAFKLVKVFTYNNTVKDLSIKFKLSQSNIRYHLNKFVLYPNKYSLSKKWSPPKKISHIKVINALIANPKAANNPKAILRLPGMSKKLVNDYWFYATGLNLESY